MSNTIKRNDSYQHNQVKRGKRLPLFQVHSVSSGRRSTRCRTPRSNEQLRTCYAKRVFPTEWDAIGGALSASRRFGELRYYHCPYCQQYHLTSQVESLASLEVRFENMEFGVA